MNALNASVDGRDDAAFLQAFESLALPPAAFKHAEHLRAAWCCFHGTRDFANGATRFVHLFKRYVAAIGAESKYHETITWFHLILVHERMVQAPGATWPEFRARNADLFAGGLPLLRARYRPETLASSLARRVFLLPDLPAAP